MSAQPFDANTPIPDGPFAGMTYGEFMHQSSIFPHGRPDGFWGNADGSVMTQADVDARIAGCPYCPDFVRTLARERLAAQTPMAADQ